MNRPIKIFCSNCDIFPKDVGVTVEKNSVIIECKKCNTAIKLDYAKSEQSEVKN